MKASIWALVFTGLLVTVMGKGAPEDWTFEDHNDSSIQNYVGSCYRKEYTFYSSFQCETLKMNCVNGNKYCSTIDDPRDFVDNRAARLAGTIVGAVVGGLCLIGCCFTCCAAYFGMQYYQQYTEQ